MRILAIMSWLEDIGLIDTLNPFPGHSYWELISLWILCLPVVRNRPAVLIALQFWSNRPVSFCCMINDIHWSGYMKAKSLYTWMGCAHNEWVVQCLHHWPRDIVDGSTYPQVYENSMPSQSMVSHYLSILPEYDGITFSNEMGIIGHIAILLIAKWHCAKNIHLITSAIQWTIQMTQIGTEGKQMFMTWSGISPNSWLCLQINLLNQSALGSETIKIWTQRRSPLPKVRLTMHPLVLRSDNAVDIEERFANDSPYRQL